MHTDARSSYADENLGDLMAAGTAHSVVHSGQAQYSTPAGWARYFAGLLPGTPDHVFDPQCADGHLLRDFRWDTLRLGIELDNRLRGQPAGPGMPMQRITGNCVQVWSLLDELFPDLSFACQCVNPPFGLRWKLPARPGVAVSGPETVDSVAHTWAKVAERTAPGGYGYFIAGRGSMDQLGLEAHPWVYLVQHFPAGLFPGVGIDISVAHWHRSPGRFRTAAGGPMVAAYSRCDTEEHRRSLEAVRMWYRSHPPGTPAASDDEALQAAWQSIASILEEERRGLPKHNVSISVTGHLRLSFGTRFQLQRKLTPAELLRLEKAEGCHPLTLTAEVETRKLLRDLSAEGFSVSPEARTAIADALRAVDAIALPLRPVTDFEKVAYVDELDSLTVRLDFDPRDPAFDCKDGAPAFTPGRRYPLHTASFSFTEKFSRKRVHWSEELGTHTVDHDCELSGTDRYVAVTDDTGLEHRFMDRPPVTDGAAPLPAVAPPRYGRAARMPAKPAPAAVCNHPEHLLWQIFQEPVVRTVADVVPELVARNLARLERIAASIAA